MSRPDNNASFQPISLLHCLSWSKILGTFQDSKIGQVDPRKTFVQTWPEAWSISGFSRFLGCCTFQQMKQRKIFDRLLQSNNAPAHPTAAEAVLGEKLFQEQACKLGR